MKNRVYSPYSDPMNNPNRTNKGISVAPAVRGKVVMNRDPMNLGRIKVKITALYGSLADKDLPWCVPCVPFASYSSGCVIIPEVNSTVWVMFENGDIYRPVWIGCSYGGDYHMSGQVGNTDGFPRDKIMGDYDTPKTGFDLNKRVLYQSPTGSIIYFDDTSASESVIVRDNSGNELVLGEESYFQSRGGIKIKFVDDDGQLSLECNKGILNAFATTEGKIDNSGFKYQNDSEGKKFKIYLDTEEIRIDFLEKLKIRVDKDSCTLKYKDVSFIMTDNTFTLSYKSVKIVGTDNNLMMTNGASTVNLVGGAVDISAPNLVNITAPYVNIS